MSDNPYREEVDHPQFNESIHSFILRHQLMHDPNIKPVGVISSGGGWREPAYSLMSSQYLFASYPDVVLLEIITDGLMVTGRGNGLHDSPVEYAAVVEETFFHNYEKLPRPLNVSRISFCEHCIQESVNKFGFGYFKTEWIHGTRCSKHNLYLTQLPLDGLPKNFKRVKKLLMGGVVTGLLKDDSVFKGHPTSNGIDMFSRKDTSFFPIKAARCALISYLKFRDECKNKRVKVYLEPDDMLWPPKGKKYGGNPESVLNHINELFMYGHHDNEEDVKYFLAENIEVVRIDVGPRKQGNLVELVSKKEGLDCNECKYKSCYMKKVGEHKQVSNDDIIKGDKVDLAFLFKNSYSTSRFSSQGIIASFSMMHIWSPISLD